MATPVSFDITSGVDLQEVDNAVNQARKEVAQRYDFKGSRAAIELNKTDNTLVLTADDDFKMTALWEILQGRLVRRGVPTKNLTPGEIERAANDTVKRVVTLQQGIPSDAAREIVYGMPYADWVAQHQTEASAEKKAAFEVAFRENVGEKR